MPIGLQPVPLDGGVNTQRDPMAIADNQLQSAKNFCGRQGQDPGVRPAMRFDRLVIPDYREWDATRLDGGATQEKYHQWARLWRPMRFIFPPFGGDVCGVFQTTAARQIIDTTATTNTPVTLAEQEAVLWMLPSLYAGGDVNGGPYVFRLGTCTRMPSLFVFDGRIYAFGGSNSGGHIRPNSSGTVGGTLGWDYYANEWTTPQLGGFVPDGGAVVRDRVVYWKGNRIYWSDRGDPLTVWANADSDGYIPITGEEQEAITAVAELSTTADGSPVQSVVAVWTKTRCYLLLGEPLQYIDAADVSAENPILGSLQINRLNIECGCVAPATVTRTPYGTFWVGADDVWFMPLGSLPIRIGTNIRPSLRAVPPGLAHRLVAEYENGFYRIALPGAEMDGASPLAEIWSLDLNKGPPQSSDQAAWWGPHTLCNGDSPDVAGGGSEESEGGGASGIWAWSRDSRNAGDGRLYSLQTWLINRSGASGYNPYGMSLCSWDQFGMRDVGAPVMEPRPWQAGQAYFAGDTIVPSPRNALEFRAAHFVCVTSGTSGGAEPDWYASGAVTIADGTAQWRTLYTEGGRPLSSYRCLSHQTSNNLEWELISKEYTLGDAISEKLLDGAELAFTSTVPQQLTYSTNPDQQERSRVVGTTPTQVDNNTGSFVGFHRKQRKLMTADPTQRFNAQTAVMSLRSDAGYVIEEGFNDTIHVLTGAGVDTIVIPAGFYEDIQALASAVCAKSSVVGLRDTFSTDGGVYRARCGFKDSGDTVNVGLYAYSVLAGYFGYTPAQVGTSTAAPNFFVGDNSYELKQASDMQINALNIRFGVFGRRPT